MTKEGSRPEFELNAVVYATDFTETSENAGRFAQLLAKEFSAELYITHAFILTQAAMDAEMGHGPSSQQRKALSSLLNQKAGELTVDSIKIIPALTEGSPIDAVPALAETHAPSIIVLGTHGPGRIMHELVGSLAEEILRSTRSPCLTVGPHVPRLSPEVSSFRRILFATDFTPAASRAVVYALAFAQASGGDIDVLNVVPEGARKHPEHWAELERRYCASLDELVPQQYRDFCRPHTFVEAGNAHDRIMGHIREHSIDLLVLGLRKASHLDLEMRTSGAFRLIVDAICPVLTVIS